LSEAALIVEPSLDPELNLRLRQLCLDALAGLPDDDRSLRLRVTARMADVCHYLGDRQAAAAACAALDRLLDAEADPSAVVVALHAQQLEASGPADVAKRGRLAEHLATVARQLGDSGQAAWAHLWLVDIVLQNGDLSRARLELNAAYRVGVDAADVLVRWQFLRAEATLAQAQARYEDAKRHADEAAALLSARGNPLGWMIWTGQQASIRYHTGFDEGFAQACGLLDEVPTTLPAAPVVHVACNVVTLLQIGRPQRAAALYQSLGPADRWQFPPHSTLFTYTYGLIAAIGLGRRDDVVHLRARLAEFRGHHVVASAGCVAYFGPVELWLGLASAFLGEDEAAVADLEYATAACRMNGAAGFHTQAQVELATMLLHVGGLDNTRRGRAVASEALERAELLGMTPFAARARALLGRADGAVPDVLTRRELEVAELVADALSNRAIAQRLHLSERTVANHVQHIFEKLGFTNRGQIVAWIHDRRHE
jgi:DNA-binding CsgD family transcriptional regulator